MKKSMNQICKALFSFFASLFFFQSAFSLGHSTSRIKVVFDINGVTMDGYEPTPGFGDLLALLLKDPRIEIYFFSTQRLPGILRQLQRVKLPDGRTADQVAKIFDGSYMGDFDEPGNSNRSSENQDYIRKSLIAGDLYKDLRVIAKDRDLENTILVDDTFRNAHPSQLRNLLWLREDIGLYGHQHKHENVDRSSPKKGFWASAWRFLKPPPPPSAVDDNSISYRRRYDNFRSDYMAGLIMSAVQLADKEAMSVSDALSTLQWGEVVEGARSLDRLRSGNESEVHKFIQRGRELKTQVAPIGLNCGEILR